MVIEKKKKVGTRSTYQWSNVALDTTRSQTDNNDGHDEASQTGAMCQGVRN